MNSAAKLDRVADDLARRIQSHGGDSRVRSIGRGNGIEAVRVAATAYDGELTYVIDGGQATADANNVDPQRIYPAIADLPSACRIEIWHGDRAHRPLSYRNGRDAARCLALAGALPGSRVSVRIRFANPESVIPYTDRVLDAMRGAIHGAMQETAREIAIRTAGNVIPFPGRAGR